MNPVVHDPRLAERLRAERALSGADRYDEVWEGTYMMSPLADDVHQEVQTGLVAILQTLIGWRGLGLVRAGVNLSDRQEGWEHNYRCPDVVVFMNGTAARNCGSHWVGGADFAVEIVSAHDRVRDKLGFYAKVGLRELLLVDREPSWAPELFRLDPASGQLVVDPPATVENALVLASRVVPVTFQLVPGETRPALVVTRGDAPEQWRI